ncbi:MAG: transketolase C-terminal domain-containing protein, partial [Eubacteriales bacterium]
GSDGETHQGIFDLSFLSSIPNMTVMAPKNRWELVDMLQYAVTVQAPIAIRYPRGMAYEGLQEYRSPILYGKGEVLYEEAKTALLPVGSMVETAIKVREKLKEEGRQVSIYNARFVKPIDKSLIRSISKKHTVLVTMEENVASGGFGERVRAFIQEEGLELRLVTIAIPDMFVEHGTVEILKREIRIDEVSITETIRNLYRED